jgi:hypothetical protein
MACAGGRHSALRAGQSGRLAKALPAGPSRAHLPGGDFAYLGAGLWFDHKQSGIHVVNVADPARPREAAFVAGPTATKLFMRG